MLLFWDENRSIRKRTWDWSVVGEHEAGDPVGGGHVGGLPGQRNLTKRTINIVVCCLLCKQCLANTDT